MPVYGYCVEEQYILLSEVIHNTPMVMAVVWSALANTRIVVVDNVTLCGLNITVATNLSKHLDTATTIISDSKLSYACTITNTVKDNLYDLLIY